MPPIITAHWSASGPHRISDYHTEFALTKPMDATFLAGVRAAAQPADVDFEKLLSFFTIWKNFPLTESLSYGTWHMNNSPFGGGANIEVGALCMGGEAVSITQWGQWPYTKAHAWVHALIVARICVLKGLDPTEHFSTPLGFENGPIFVVSTHGERAYQTVNPGFDDSNHRGYGLYSGDPDMRWDLAVFEQADTGRLADYPHAHQATFESAQWLRAQSAALKSLHGNMALPGVDGDVTP